MLLIRGGATLSGRVSVDGSKNACLPEMAAALLAATPSRMRRVPQIEDVRTMSDLLQSVGASVTEPRPGELIISPGDQLQLEPSPRITGRIRASILLLGPLLARHGFASIARPGGDDIGLRKIDQHLMGLRALGAEVEDTGSRVTVRARGRLRGNRVMLDLPTVTGTENVMMCAVLAEGRTEIWHAAREPHVVDLARMLRRMGARIEGEGTEHIVIDGVDALTGTEHEVVPDYVEAGSFALLAAAAGDLEIDGAIAEDLQLPLTKLEQAGAEVQVSERSVRVRRGRELRAIDLTTWAHPGFATDLQAPYTTLMTAAQGECVISESLYENRFRHVPELLKMGADIRVQGRNALVRGPRRLHGANVAVPDIRSGFALVLAGLIAEGETVLENVAQLDRGYADIAGKLAAVGAKIERVHQGAVAPAGPANYE